MKPKEEIKQLKIKIEKHNKLYYERDNPEVSDEQYDKLLLRLKELEKTYPELKDTSSPTQKVGGAPLKDFTPVTHSIPMLSLDNSYSKEDILAWNNRTIKNLSREPNGFFAEAKIDGVSCSVIYKDGVLITAATRGNGAIGEDITSNARTIENLPKKLNNPPKGTLEIRGEVFIDIKDFEILNEQQKSQQLEPFANPRNAAAGSLRQKNPEITAKRKLSFFAHSYGKMDVNAKIETQQDFLKQCLKWGFKICTVNKLCKDINDVIEFYNKCETERNTLSYEVDGLVIKLNDFKEREKLGTTAKSPRWAMAFKYPAQQVVTVLEDVIFSVGRTGVITPTAKLKPVLCSGVTISNATLHNFDEIERLKVKIGDEVLIERAGDVIPKVIKPILSNRTGKERDIISPKICPACKSSLFKEPEEVAYKCINPSCPAQIKARILHFASRNAMDIDGFGEAVVEQLLALGFIKDFSDIYNLDLFKLLRLELFKDKKAQNLLNAIENSKSRPLEKFIFGLGIPHTGAKISSVLAERFESIDKIISASKEDIENTADIGPVIAEAVTNFFNPKTITLIKRLQDLGLKLKQPERKRYSNKLTGKSFVFTGELKTLTRLKAQEKVRNGGGKSVSSISKNTSFLVAGENSGSKLEKAKKLEVKILTEEDFLNLVS